MKKYLCFIFYNLKSPFNMTHGAPDSNIRHVGDLGNIVADSNK